MTLIDSTKYGISFSAKQCRNFDIDQNATLGWLIKQGWRRFRLMSYWDEYEKDQGSYDFTELDNQIKRITKADGSIELCLGVKQPRWPEYHWPNWATELSKATKTAALLDYIEVVVRRYKDQPAIVSYQLENEALLKNFGRGIDIDRGRLRAEYKKVHILDPSRPIHMSTSNGWGIPFVGPIPDTVGFSVYTIMHHAGAYHNTIQRPWLHIFRRGLTRWLAWRPVFIHELQCEPWGPTAIWKMPPEQQDESMSAARIGQNIRWAKRIGAYPIDLWGAEWWYWRWLNGDKSIWQSVQRTIDG
jgi:hypothetical protein